MNVVRCLLLVRCKVLVGCVGVFFRVLVNSWLSMLLVCSVRVRVLVFGLSLVVSIISVF